MPTLVSGATRVHTLARMKNGGGPTPLYKSATWTIRGEKRANGTRNERAEPEPHAPVYYCFGEPAGPRCDDERGPSGDGLIQTFIRTHCRSIYSLTRGKQINCVINKFYRRPPLRRGARRECHLADLMILNGFLMTS